MGIPYSNKIFLFPPSFYLYHFCHSSQLQKHTQAHIYIIEYIVTFISDGVIIREAKYHYGDTVDAIQAPKKASDDDYSYEFVGWDKTITEVNGDAVYTAVFDSRPLERPVIADKVSIIKIIKIVGIIILSGCCISLFIIITRKKLKNINKRGK